MPNRNRILFIDPASRSSGWAQFLDGKFEKAWTLSFKDKDQFQRLVKIRETIKQLIKPGDVDEAHIETMNYGVHYACIWSVGVIGETLASMGIKVYQDIPVSAWQKASDWKNIQHMWNEVHAPKVFESEDEWAAYHMGIYWLKKNGVV